MWSYYGSKSRLVNLYPPPKYGKIIEPFAGSARYSLKYFDRDILLVDKYEVIVKIWHYLQKCSPADILGLPKLTKGDKLSNYNLSEGERLFLGMCAGAGSPAPRNTVSMFAAEQNLRKNRFKQIADNLCKIKHWKIIHGSYDELENEEATWFIDPPYERGGSAYVESSKKIDFNKLAGWCKSRTGQVIVCENSDAKWLPFKDLKRSRGVNRNFTVESIWTNDTYGQTVLFD